MAVLVKETDGCTQQYLYIRSYGTEYGTLTRTTCSCTEHDQCLGPTRWVYEAITDVPIPSFYDIRVVVEQG
ncbi:predicted protein [Sclerotinia sclerotiorum 1980 UF-70]|uniref:Uncharacterized protein n=1 Tax=Sclerotinia sclerotiorum (strain ATCC 18683 / 1980 / Ss-1) TaxID=665079 RepID=A7F3I1_SCLS1|nr:predicted protein [Sclerotinia sclerotiorum 1980 UF-70]EDN97302.1 predicted protein [Sclerotinia sclerotiorum 1980 UF-70]